MLVHVIVFQGGVLLTTRFWRKLLFKYLCIKTKLTFSIVSMQNIFCVSMFSNKEINRTLLFQNLSDMSELPHLEEDFKITEEIAAQILMYKAYRYC